MKLLMPRVERECEYMIVPVTVRVANSSPPYRRTVTIRLHN